MTRQVKGRLRITIRLSIARLLREIGWLPFIARAGSPVLSVSIHCPTSAEIMQTIKVASNSLVRSGSPSLVLNVWLTNCHMAWRNGEHILLAHASHNVQRNPSQMDLLHFAVGSCFVIKGTLQTSDACIKRGMHALHVIYNGFVLCFPETMLWLAQSIRSCRLSQLIHVAFTESCESGSAPEASRGRPCTLHRLQSVILMAWSSFSSLARLF